MTYAELVEIAEEVAAQRIIIENYNRMNTPTDFVTRVKLDASIMIARDKLYIMTAEYEKALRQYVNQP